MPSDADEVLRHMAAHRTIRQFRTTPVPDADVRRAVEAASMASTSSWIQAYCLLQVTDASERHALRELTGEQAQVEEAGAFFCVCADIRRHRMVAREADADYAGNLEVFLQAVVDASLFAQNLALAFEAQGWGICFIGGLRNRIAEVDRLLELPSGVLPLFGLCVGEPAPGAPQGTEASQRPRLAPEAVWTRERYWSDEALAGHLADMDRRAAAYYTERGQDGRDWTGGIWRTFQRPRREHLHEYYESKGASLR